MFANNNTPEFLQMAGSTRQTRFWINEYAHLFWQIIGIGEDPLGDVQTISPGDVGTLQL